MINSIGFFCPSREFGGAENLVIKISKELIRRGIRVTIIDYENGIVTSILSKTEEIELITYEDGRKFLVRNVTHIISFSYWIETIIQLLVTESKIFLLFWFIHPYHIFHLIKPIQSSRASYIYLNYIKKIRFMLSLMNEKGSLKFMDRENFFIAKEYFKLDFNPDFIQIPVINKDHVLIKSKKESEELGVAWIGRLPQEKVNILLYVLSQVRQWSLMNKKNIHFYIVGNGLAEGLLNDFLRVNDFKYLKITRIPHILPEEIPEFLNGKKLMFAMGTSALEGGAEKIPTILLDYTYYNFQKIIRKGYKFKWLFQTVDFNLGSDIFKSRGLIKQENHLTIDDVFNVILDPVKRDSVAEKCYDYCIKNHTIEVVILKLMTVLENCRLSADDLSVININKNRIELAFDKVYYFKERIRKKLL